jgi:hypothetical protein
MCFAGFGKAVIKSLPLTSALGVGEESMVVVGKCEHLARVGFLVRNTFEFSKALVNEAYHVGFHTDRCYYQIPRDLFWLRPGVPITLGAQLKL